MVPRAGRPPVFLGLDNISHILTDSHYTTIDSSGKLKPIHAHDFVLVKHFIDYLSGAKTMPNGGLVIASTSRSDHVKSSALDVSIAMAEARKTSDPPLSSTEALRIEQFWSPYKTIDQRSVEALKDIETIRLEGLKKEEARAIMEYWAISGLVRKEIGDRFVGEKWSLAGGGVIGELEKAVVRSGRL
jgi:small subunit ribosomal protein S29